MISILGAGDDDTQWAFLDDLTAPSIDRIKTPERYTELRRCKDELEKYAAGLRGKARAHYEAVFGRVSSALHEYEDADPNQIVNDMLDARRRA